MEKRNAGQQEELLDDDRIVFYRVLKVSVGQHLRKTYTHNNVLPCKDNIFLYMYINQGVSIQMQYNYKKSLLSAAFIEQLWLFNR